MAKKKEKIYLACENCGFRPDENKDKSTENWKVYDAQTPCPKCGGEIKIQLNI